MITQEKIAVMQAYADGKTIQVKTLGGEWVDWVLNEPPTWNWKNHEYRVKPKPKEPTYRPYKDFNEFHKDWEKHGGWVFRKDNGTYELLCMWRNTYVEVMFEKYTWADDGSPCGAKIEE